MTQESELTIEQLGWASDYAEAFQEYADAGLAAGRVAIEHRGAYVLRGGGEVWAELSGRLRRTTAAPVDRPAVGDWVAYERPQDTSRARIQAVLPRRSAVVRRAAGEQEVEQVVAANVDVLFVVTLDGRRPQPGPPGAVSDAGLGERRRPGGGADQGRPVREPRGCAAAGRVGRLRHSRSRSPRRSTGEGTGRVAARIAGGRTGACVGSSGVGKSTLINALVGDERMATGEVRSDGRGRHTTSHRELIVLPDGGCLIDTPGMRELQLWEAAEGLERAFADVEELAAQCRFRDCAHETEPGCAVQAAIADGSLPAHRLEGYRRLLRELEFQQRRGDKRAQAAAKKQWAAISKSDAHGQLVGRSPLTLVEMEQFGCQVPSTGCADGDHHSRPPVPGTGLQLGDRFFLDGFLLFRRLDCGWAAAGAHGSHPGSDHPLLAR